MKNKFAAFGARQFSLETLVGGRPGTTIFQNPGGGGEGGGSHTRTGPGCPPVPRCHGVVSAPRVFMEQCSEGALRADWALRWS